MRNLLIAAALLALSPAAHAQSANDLVFSRPDAAAMTLPLPEGVAKVECDVEPIGNFFCLRTDAPREDAVLSQLAGAIVAQGWTLLGEDRKSRPFTSIFRLPQQNDACPLSIMLLSLADARNTSDPPPEGMVDITITLGPEPMCLLDKLSTETQRTRR